MGGQRLGDAEPDARSRSCDEGSLAFEVHEGAFLRWERESGRERIREGRRRPWGAIARPGPQSFPIGPRRCSRPADARPSSPPRPRRGRAPSSPPSSSAKIRSRARRSRSEEHTSELQSLMRISYAVFCLKKKKAKER